jgi:cytochrome P450
MFERFDSLGRPVSPLATAAPLPFGRGPHFCPGMLLTDVVADTAWRALVDVIDFPDHGRIREKLEPGHVTNQHASLSMPFDHCL